MMVKAEAGMLLALLAGFIRVSWIDTPVKAYNQFSNTFKPVPRP
jgi:hypothetical protein